MQKFKFIKLTKDESDTSGSSLKGKLKYGSRRDRAIKATYCIS